MAKKSSINITKNMADKIPYLRCYEEQGIIETEYKVFEKWDSLMMMNLLMEVEDEYEVSIPLESAGKIKTLKDLFDLTA